MGDPWPSLEAHLCYTHCFGVQEVAGVDVEALRELHESEHAAGYRGHQHEDGDA